jgi:hypothetical protein
MNKLTREHIEAIRSSEMLIEHVKSYLEHSFWLLTMALDDMPSDAFDRLYDACLNAWRNDAPLVEELLAEQDKGVYGVEIRGVPGAYFSTAPEYDDDGPFTTLQDAQNAVWANFGEFILKASAGDEDEVEDDDAE